MGLEAKIIGRALFEEALGCPQCENVNIDDFDDSNFYNLTQEVYSNSTPQQFLDLVQSISNGDEIETDYIYEIIMPFVDSIVKEKYTLDDEYYYVKIKENKIKNNKYNDINYIMTNNEVYFFDTLQDLINLQQDPDIESEYICNVKCNNDVIREALMNSSMMDLYSITCSLSHIYEDKCDGDAVVLEAMLQIKPNIKYWVNTQELDFRWGYCSKEEIELFKQEFLEEKFKKDLDIIRFIDIDKFYNEEFEVKASKEYDLIFIYKEVENVW